MEGAGWSLDSGNDDLALVDRERISAVRRRIDELDRQSAALLSERLQLARELADSKERLRLPVLDTEREAEVLSRLDSTAADPEMAAALKAIWQSIIAQSRNLQERSRRTAGTPYFTRVAVIGTGLIGGALCRQIKRALPKTVVVGTDRPDVLKQAMEEGVIDQVAADAPAAVRGASLVVLAAGPDQNLKLLAEIAPHLKSRQLVVDVTSVKGQICALAERLDLNGADFIGGHPLFGSEKSGFKNSAAVALEGKVFCLVPTIRSSQMAIRRLSRWLSVLDMRPRIVDATTHDAVMARLSHQVQLLSTLLGCQLAAAIPESGMPDALGLAGPSFRQLSRLMSSDSTLWGEIVAHNREEILRALEEFQDQLHRLTGALRRNDTSALQNILASATAVASALAEADARS